jgi:hypothetical protein
MEKGSRDIVIFIQLESFLSLNYFRYHSIGIASHITR